MHLAVDGHAAVLDPALGLAARAQPGARQRLGDAHRLGGPERLGRLGRLAWLALRRRSAALTEPGFAHGMRLLAFAAGCHCGQTVVVGRSEGERHGRAACRPRRDARFLCETDGGRESLARSEAGAGLRARPSRSLSAARTMEDHGGRQLHRHAKFRPGSTSTKTRWSRSTPSKGINNGEPFLHAAWIGAGRPTAGRDRHAHRCRHGILLGNPIDAGAAWRTRARFRDRGEACSCGPSATFCPFENTSITAGDAVSHACSRPRT